MLNVYLKRAGVITGPLRKNTSHSGMAAIKRALLGLPPFKGGERFLVFGNVLHELFLEGKSAALKRLTLEEQQRVIVMVDKLNSHPVVKSLMANSIREEKFYSSLNNVEVAVILDIKQPKLKRGADLKSTNCATLEEFVTKAKALGYFSQGLTYKKTAKLDHFYFIAIDKEPPHNISIVDVSKYPEEERYAEREMEFLLYFYRHYGNAKAIRKYTAGKAAKPKAAVKKATKKRK